jgi:hypothetical protein
LIAEEGFSSKKKTDTFPFLGRLSKSLLSKIVQLEKLFFPNFVFFSLGCPICSEKSKLKPPRPLASHGD